MKYVYSVSVPINGYVIQVLESEFLITFHIS